MKTLLLLRHAKSSWDDARLRDFERPLAQRGIRDAPRIGKALAKLGPTPDLIISSPAARASQTIAAVVQAAGLDAALTWDEAIYGAVPAELIRIVRRIPNSSSCAMLVGHNPGFEDLLSRLTGVPEHMPTAALACVQFQVDAWADVEDGQGTLAWFITPKHLDDQEH
ncbi:MAG TPA: histidine phosphatase family protein [Blastocatellia bacterium]|jgi:phosphohistidine phosphatase|nr:histidine phosphatase family protein [Blastocatellia bacterium]